MLNDKPFAMFFNASPRKGWNTAKMLEAAKVGAEEAGAETELKQRYETPDGFSDIWMAADGDVLTGLWFEGSRDESRYRLDREERDSHVFREVRRWLDIYFSGRQPGFTPRYRLDGLTPFRREIVDAILAIPFGETVTYGDIAAALAGKRGVAKMSARAVGGAVGWNPLCIIIPCHRVVGANGKLTGYGGGMDNKISLLRLEGRILPCHKASARFSRIETQGELQWNSMK